MKLLLDQGLPRSTVKRLADAGVVAEHVGDLGMAAAADQTILDFARVRQFTIVTLDADFHQLLAATRAVSPSVIRLQIEGLKGGRGRTLGWRRRVSLGTPNSR
jgi:predicted nuclease of predicted toxin-antitoxin system